MLDLPLVLWLHESGHGDFHYSCPKMCSSLASYGMILPAPNREKRPGRIRLFLCLETMGPSLQICPLQCSGSLSRVQVHPSWLLFPGVTDTLLCTHRHSRRGSLAKSSHVQHKNAAECVWVCGWFAGNFINSLPHEERESL